MKIFALFILITLQGFCFDKSENDPIASEEIISDLVQQQIKIESKNNNVKSDWKEEIIAPETKALIFTDDPVLFDNKSLEGFQGIVLKGICVKNIENFKKEFSCFLNQALTLESLKKIKNLALTYFKKNTPYFIDVKILENQEISSGKVQILVMFAKVGEVSVRGGKYFSNYRLMQKLDLSLDEYLDIRRIQKSLASINQNPFRKTSLILEPGEQLGYTNVHFQTEDIFPLRIFSGYENTGNEIASQHRFLAGLNFGNFLYLDHQMNLEFKFAPSISKWWGFSGNYILPAYYDTYFKLIGSYVKTKPDTIPNYVMQGKAWNILLRYYIPVYFFENAINEFILGYDFKRTNNFLKFLATLVFNNFIDVSQFVLQLSSTSNDKYGLTKCLFSFYFSPGDMTSHNENKNFRTEGYAQKSKYFYATLHLDRTFLMSKDFLFVLEFVSQISANKLLPTEQISIGGFYSVRGYQENAVFADDGFYLRNELRLPKMKYVKYKHLDHAGQLLTFVDLGYASNIDDNISNKKSSFLASVGPGFRFSANDNFILKLDYGIQLKKANRDFFAKSWHSKLHAFVSFQY